MDIETDEVKSTLVNNEIQKTLRSYTVVGKVLAVDLIDTDKFENHFLLTAASLGAQLLKTYDLGVDKMVIRQLLLLIKSATSFLIFSMVK